jgi:hypothetical protein
MVRRTPSLRSASCAPAEPDPPSETSSSSRGADGTTQLVAQLVHNFRDQVRRVLDVELDGSETSLAFVDHYLAMARTEDREPILALLAAGAGAYFGEIVRTELGATWIGDGVDPRRLRVLMAAQFIYFSPVDQAYEAITGESLSEQDPRVPDRGATFDPAFHLRPPSPDDTDGAGFGGAEASHDDARWLEDRLGELPPVSEDHFHSLTCRFETLKLMLELLAAKHASEGRSPVEHGVEDYLTAFAQAD